MHKEFERMKREKTRGCNLVLVYIKNTFVSGKMLRCVLHTFFGHHFILLFNTFFPLFDSSVGKCVRVCGVCLYATARSCVCINLWSVCETSYIHISRGSCAIYVRGHQATSWILYCEYPVKCVQRVDGYNELTYMLNCLINLNTLGMKTLNPLAVQRSSTSFLQMKVL